MIVSKWILAAGARPNFMKAAPLIRAIKTYNISNGERIIPLLVHTGQHYDFNMSDSFFKDLNLPEPDVHLGIGSGSHGEQTGKVLIEFEKVLITEQPSLVIVVGDVNSTLACTLAAAKLHIPVAHVEAGLRSFDRKMPEEINRVVTDALSEFLFTPSPDANENLLKDGIPKDKIFLVGNIMVDSLLFHLEQAKQSTILEQLGITKNLHAEFSEPNSVKPYALLTLHRPNSVDDKNVLVRIIHALTEISKRIPIVFPAHPRTRKMISQFDLLSYFVDRTHCQSPITNNGIFLVNPLGYLDFLNLMAHARIVLTDSGGIQEETTVMNIPCITLRDTTERPITLTEGTNVLVHHDEKKIVSEARKILEEKRRQGKCPSMWDGHTAERIVEVLAGSSIVPNVSYA
jgi:UDP-N-acetylglucosamine 2-epimerase (non-hydrolysing)